MFIVEKETNDKITGDYPVVRFIEQVNQINRYYEEQEKALSKGRITNKTFK